MQGGELGIPAAQQGVPVQPPAVEHVPPAATALDREIGIVAHEIGNTVEPGVADTR